MQTKPNKPKQTSKMMTIQELSSAAWKEIKGTAHRGVTRDWHLKEVDIDHPVYSTAVVVQRRGDVARRAIVLDPARKDQVKHHGFV